MTNEQNILFAAFAVQMGLVPAPRALEATASWAADPSIALPERLLAMGALTESGRATVARMLQAAELEFGGDAGAALRAAAEDPEGLGRYFLRDALWEGSPEDISTEAGAGVADDRPSAESILNETPGRYRRESEYARGGMGRVLLVHDAHLGRDIAMKELLPNVSRSGETLSVGAASPVRLSASLINRFLQEARITGQLEHPSIVPVYELGHRRSGQLYYTMKLVRGETLSRAIHHAEGPKGRLALLPHFTDLCQAIAYAHSRGVLHRDIKPSNVMVGEFGETVVLDWGLAKGRGIRDVHREGFAGAIEALRGGDELALAETEYGQIVGTPAYMSPEQARGHLDKVDERSDVYSLGAVLYELLTGRTPHGAATRVETLKRASEGRCTPVLSVCPDAPPELAAICEKALQPESACRYQSARELADEILAFQSGAVVRAYEYSVYQILHRFYRRHRALVQFSGAALLVLATSLAYFNVRLYQSRQAERGQRLAAEASNAQLRGEVYASTMIAAQRYVNEGNLERALTYLSRCPQEERGWEWGHLRRACQPFLAEAPHDPLKIRTMNPLCCRFSDDGNRVLSKWNMSGVVTIYDRARAAYVYYSPMDHFLGFPGTVEFGPDEGHITAGLNYTTVVYHDWVNDQTVREFSIAAGWLISFKVSPDARTAVGLAYNEVGGLRNLIVWDFQTGAEIRRIALSPQAHPGYGNATDQMRPFQIMNQHPFGVVGGFIDGSAKVVFSDSDLCVLDLNTGKLSRKFPVVDGTLDVDPARGRAVYIREDGEVGQWDLQADRALPDLVEEARPLSVVYGGRERLFIGLRERRNRWSIWDADTGALIERYQSDTLALYGLDIADTEPVAVTLAAGSHLRFWELGLPPATETKLFRGSDGQPMPHDVWAPYGSPYRSFAIHPDRTLLALLASDNEIRLWNIPEMTLARRWYPHDDRVQEIGFSHDGTLMTTVAWDGWAKVWSVATGELVRAFAPETDEACYTAALTPDNATIALGYGERSMQNATQSPALFYSIATGALERREALGGGRINDLAFSPDGSLLISGVWGLNGSDEHTFALYRMPDLTTPAGHVSGEGWGDHVIFDARGSHALLYATSLTPTYFDLGAMRPVYTLTEGQVMSVNLHPSGDRFVTNIHYTHQANVHRARDGRLLASLDGALGPAFYSADGRELYSLTKDGQVRVFRASEWP